MILTMNDTLWNIIYFIKWQGLNFNLDAYFYNTLFIFLIAISIHCNYKYGIFSNLLDSMCMSYCWKNCNTRKPTFCFLKYSYPCNIFCFTVYSYYPRFSYLDLLLMQLFLSQISYINLTCFAFAQYVYVCQNISILFDCKR